MNCGPAKMNAKDIVGIQMDALQTNSGDNGIRLAYKYLSPDYKSKLGTYQNFRDLILTSYQPLLNCQEWKYMSTSTSKSSNNVNKYTQDIFLINTNTVFLYSFKLSRQYDFRHGRPSYDYYSNMCLNKYWRTDSIILKQSYPVEFFDNEAAPNVYGEALELCSLNPKTGFYRDGYCNTDSRDYGTHTVCAEVTDQFLQFTKTKGNDLSTPSPDNIFPGLKHGDKWCLCANRYKEAVENNINMKVNKRASHRKTLDYLKFDQLS